MSSPGIPIEEDKLAAAVARIEKKLESMEEKLDAVAVEVHEIKAPPSLVEGAEGS